MSTFRRELLVPAAWGNRVHFPYLIIFRPGEENRPPVYFVTSGRNYGKFAAREAEGFKIIGHVKDRDDATAIQREMNDELKTGVKKKRAGYQIAVTKDPSSIDSKKLWVPKKYRRK